MVDLTAPRSSRFRLEMGAVLESGGVSFRVWAPRTGRVEVELAGQGLTRLPMQRRADGVWEAFAPGLDAGTRYKYRLDAEGAFPDPYSRSQPKGVHGPSEVVDPDAHQWRDRSWPGLDRQHLVIYECHVGTMTPAGTFDGLIDQLPRLKRLGVTALEVMPVAEFSGRRNWGYDGVYLFAPSANYGGAAALKRLVDAAHQHGLGVILDVVYNHLGPEGNYLRHFSADYFTSRYQTPWGDAINYDGPNSQRVRQYVVDNACHWITEYHVDGLRLDATFKMFDRSPRHILQELTEAVRGCALPGRQIVLIAETSENEVRYLRSPAEGGFGFDVVWADDFHHSLRRYLAGDADGYYRDYQGTLAEVARTVTQGFLFEGEWSEAFQSPRGTPARQQPAWQFLYCLQNHDQVGNRAFGDRLHHVVDLDRYRAASALLLCLPMTPLLFMGQEFAASSPFLYFTDHSPELGRLVRDGRRAEFAAYRAFADPAVAERIPDPQAEDTFLHSKLPLVEAEASPGAGIHHLYQELLRLRREDAVLAVPERATLEVRALSADLLLVRRWRGAAQRLLVACFGPGATVELERLAGPVAGPSSSIPRRSASAGLARRPPWRLRLSISQPSAVLLASQLAG